MSDELHEEQVSGDLAEDFSLDPRRNWLISCFGRKGSGKSHFNRQLYRQWPSSKLCIDVNGEASPGPDAVKIRKPAHEMPDGKDGLPVNLHYVVDPGSPTYRDDLDAAVGMAMYPSGRQTLVWCGEVGEFTTGNRTGPHLRRLLMQSRHYRTSALFDGPRPMDIDKLVIAQSDIVVLFDLPDPDDRFKVAKIIGRNPRTFAAQCDDVFSRGKYWHLLYAASSHRLYAMPPTTASR